jgi:hypothetical protein
VSVTTVWVVFRDDWDGDEFHGVYASLDAVRVAFPDPIRWKDATYQGHVEWIGEAPRDDAMNPRDYRARPVLVQE